jgi:hypothetical protein
MALAMMFAQKKGQDGVSRGVRDDLEAHSSRSLTPDFYGCGDAAHTTLGWTTRVAKEDGLRRMVDWVNGLRQGSLHRTSAASLWCPTRSKKQRSTEAVILGRVLVFANLWSKDGTGPPPYSEVDRLLRRQSRINVPR